MTHAYTATLDDTGKILGNAEVSQYAVTVGYTAARSKGLAVAIGDGALVGNEPRRNGCIIRPDIFKLSSQI